MLLGPRSKQVWFILVKCGVSLLFWNQRHWSVSLEVKIRVNLLGELSLHHPSWVML